MLVLFETPAGYALFKMIKDGKFKTPEDVVGEFKKVRNINDMVKLKAFSKFDDTAEALEAATALVDGDISKDLKKLIKKEVISKDLKETLAVCDKQLAASIAKKFGIQVLSDNVTNEIMREIRGQIAALIEEIPQNEFDIMALGLSHSLSRYKIKFSPDKVDTMIVQAIGLLDDLDKELNTYAMRLKEWYGWHFPELAKVVSDNQAYAKLVKLVGVRHAFIKTDLSEILPEAIEKQVKQLSQLSMGTDVSEEDMLNIHMLADQVISLSQYRDELFEYLKNRMLAIAPNLTCLVGELVGARLIAHAGSLLNLAKHSASTVQILGAEKALFRALKTKSQTPKYGLIYHASLIGQAAPKLKGKISRALAAKASLAVRVDAFGDKDTPEMGAEARIRVENRLKSLENTGRAKAAGSAKIKPQQKKQDYSTAPVYNPAADIVLSVEKKMVEEAPDERKRERKEEKEEKKQKKHKEKI